MSGPNFKNIAFYAFYKPSYDLGAARTILLERMRELGIKGTILLAEEGINCSLSGITAALDNYLEFLLKAIGITKPEIKISYSQEIAFKRGLVKVKPVIVAKPGKTVVDPAQDEAPHISPEEFHQWIKDNKKNDPPGHPQ